MSTVKVFKKGEALYKEGEKPQSVFLIQSGSVSLTLSRQKQSIELCLLGSSQIAGEHALSGSPTNPHSAIAHTETKAIELPVEALKTQIEAGPQLLKVLTKALTDKLKVVMKDFVSMRLERDNTPCPPEQTAKIFGTVFHVARSKAETQKDGSLKINWPLMKQYAQRVFIESPKRLETAVNVFVKLGAAKYEWVKSEEDPEAPEEIGFVTFADLPLVEQFFEYYQYHYFKGGKAELLKTDERVMQLVGLLLEAAKGQVPDRHNLVSLDYTQLIEKVKASLGFQLNPDHFTAIERKGLFAKRTSTDKGVFLQFDIKEFTNTLRVWKVLREVERWNEKGSVNPKDPVEVAQKSATGGHQCPGCQKAYEGAPKFCSECGFKFTAAA